MAIVKIHGSGQKNYIINGAFDFWQRGATFNNISDNTYQADRWFGTKSQDVVNVTRQDIAALNMVARYAARFERSANSGTFQLNTNLETSVVRELKGKTITASIYLRKGSALTSDVTLLLRTTNTEARGGSTVESANFVVPNASLNTSTFTRFSVTLIVPSNTSALGIHFQASATQASGANVYFEATQGMLNEGSAASTFERSEKGIAQELASCQRFLEKSANQEDFTGAGSAGLLFEVSSQSAEVDTNYRFAVTKRAVPSVSVQGTSGFATGPTIQNTGEAGFAINGTTAAPNGNFQFHFVADAEL